MALMISWWVATTKSRLTGLVGMMFWPSANPSNAHLATTGGPARMAVRRLWDPQRMLGAREDARAHEGVV